MSFFSGDRFVFELDSKLNEVRRKAIKRAKLNHYTNIDNLLKIIDTKTFKLNSIKNMNDKLEAKYISVDNIEDLVFLSSFCHGKENIPLWHMYTEQKYGVNIEFEFDRKKHSCDMAKILHDSTRPVLGKVAYSDDVIEFDTIGAPSTAKNYSGWNIEFICSDVKYDSNGINSHSVYFTTEDGGKLYNLTSMGIVKNSAWRYEEETRIIAHFRTVKSDIEMKVLECILMPITFERLKKISITFSPWMPEEIKIMLKEHILSKVSDCKVKFKDSIYTSIVERKI